MKLQATPSAITTDGVSNWGTGGNNPQKLSVPISPDYNGIVKCRVVFAKNFATNAETLFVDPLPVLT